MKLTDRCVLVSFFLTIFLACEIFLLAEAPVQTDANGEGLTISRVIDGDTFKLSNGQTMNLAGIRTPELHDVPKLPEEAKKFGKDIWAYRAIGGDAHKIVQRMIEEKGSQIRLESDPDAFDEEGNLLAYVFVSVSDLEPQMTVDNAVIFKKSDRYEIFLNAYLLQVGVAYIVEPLHQKYQTLFRRFEEEAKASGRGLWS